MKTLATIFAAGAALTTAFVLSGVELDPPVLLSVAFTAGLAGMAARDYGRPVGLRAVPRVTAPTKRSHVRRGASAPTLMPGTIFPTTIA